jgi:hypothetical protein
LDPDQNLSDDFRSDSETLGQVKRNGMTKKIDTGTVGGRRWYCIHVINEELGHISVERKLMDSLDDTFNECGILVMNLRHIQSVFRIQDPVFLTPGSGIRIRDGKSPDPGSESKQTSPMIFPRT